MRWPRKTPGRLDFEFAADIRRGGMAAWLLLIVGLLFAADVGRSYLALRENQATVATRITDLPAPRVSSMPPPYEPKDVEREISLARTILQRIALPWNALFKALGESQTEGVVLLSVEPDADAGQLQLTAVAQDVPAMLTYLARLETNRHLSRSVITHHEITKNEPRFPVYFVVSAAWKRT